MKRTLYILSILAFMSSCATLLNPPHKYVTIHTTKPTQIIHGETIISTVDNKAHLRAERKNAPLQITAITDSLEKSIEIEQKNSVAFWTNLFNYGIGMLVDRNNPKRYTYPGKIFINSADATGGYSLFGKANNKGELYLYFSLPMVNRFRMMIEGEGSKRSVGAMGFCFGLDYYHSKNQFIHAGFSTLVGGYKTTHTRDRRTREREYMESQHFSLSNNHKFGRFSIGYGFSYARISWKYIRSRRGFIFYRPVERVEKNHNAFGLIFPSYFQLGEHLNIGIVYRPTFFRPNLPNKFAYEHLISVDLAWKIRLKK